MFLKDGWNILVREFHFYTYIFFEFNNDLYMIVSNLYDDCVVTCFYFMHILVACLNRNKRKDDVQK